MHFNSKKACSKEMYCPDCEEYSRGETTTISKLSFTKLCRKKRVVLKSRRILVATTAKSLFNTTRRRSRPSFLSTFFLRAPFWNDVPVLLLNHSVVVLISLSRRKKYKADTLPYLTTQKIVLSFAPLASWKLLLLRRSVRKP